MLRDDLQEKAFVSLRENLLRRPVLRLPDHAKPFVLLTDAWNRGLSFVLMQKHTGKYYPVAYGSKKLTSAEKRYSTSEKESLVIAWGLSKFRLYLTGRTFFLLVDRQPLTFFNDAEFKNDRIMHWTLALHRYDYTAKDISGKDNVLADYLSRIVIDPDESLAFCLKCFIVFFLCLYI